jgi:hypothetical protein
MAARLILRWRDQTTSPRHRITDIARNPSIAPTMMKTVPSGSLDCFMNGALAVGGTDGLTYAPARVGKSVAVSVLVSDGPVMLGTVAVSVVVDEEGPVIVGTVWLGVEPVVDGEDAVVGGG